MGRQAGITQHDNDAMLVEREIRIKNLPERVLWRYRAAYGFNLDLVQILGPVRYRRGGDSAAAYYFLSLIRLMIKSSITGRNTKNITTVSQRDIVFLVFSGRNILEKMKRTSPKPILILE